MLTTVRVILKYPGVMCYVSFSSIVGYYHGK